MLPRLLVVAHADEQHLTRVVRERSRVLPFLDLPDGRLRRPVPLQLDDKRRLLRVLLARQGLRVTGVDLSEEMLTVAQQKAEELENPPRFVCQSLQKLVLPRGVDLAVCALDSLDYITQPEACRQAIR